MSGVGQEPAGRALFDEAAVVEDGRAGGQGGGVAVMGDQDQGQVRVGPQQVREEGTEVPAGDGVQAGGDLGAGWSRSTKLLAQSRASAAVP
ncbi:hypothetical protein, partial [Streptomyces decoyicus]|uniref:hypothetical protein n=1 Tax=Streptomyces decoyicus TaxID=249567 RepID=UPI0033B6CED3